MFVVKMEKLLRFTLLFKIIPIFIVMTTMAITDQSRNSINFVNCSSDFPHLLMDIAQPKTYDIKLIIKPHMNITMGTMNITIHVKTVTRKLSLHAHKINVNYYKAMIKPINSSGAPNNLLSLINCNNIEVINLMFLRFLHPGLYVLYLEFFAYFGRGGITPHNPYIWNNVTKSWLITNLHSSNVTRGLFPCWDQPEVKADFSITVQHPKRFSYVLFSNFLIRRQREVDNETLLTIFYDIFSMPTYLLTFAMVDNIVSISNDINYIWSKQKVLEKMKYALEVTQYVTLEMSNMLNLRPSIIGNVNHIMIPNAPIKSMGRPGVIIYREQDVTLNKSSSVIGQHIPIIKLITYESTLQWFDRLAGLYIYSSLWIHKILSSFYSYYIPSKIWVEDRYMELFIVQYLQLALNNDDILELKPIMNEVNNDNEIDVFVFSQVYRKKGAALIQTLFHLMSPTKFEAGVSQYLNKRTTDLWTNMENFLCDKQCKFLKGDYKNHLVKEIMETWLKAKYYIELYVTRNFGNNTAYCKMKLHKNELMTNLEDWKIPITYISQSNLTSDNVMNITLYQWKNDIVITNIEPRDFIIINTKHIGYYRVNYDHKSWYKISSFLQFDNFTQIPVLNRAQLINDVYYFTINRDINVANFFNVIKYLKWEKDFIAWHPMFHILSYMSPFFEYEESSLVKTYFLEILNGIIENDDYEYQYYDSDIMPKALRVLAIKWACRLGHIKCRTAATDKLFKYLTNTEANNTIPSMWEDWVCCTGMMLANKTIWLMMLKEAERYADIKRFQYLTCTENEEFIRYYMDYLRSGSLEKLKNISITDIFFSILKKHSRKDVLLNYMLKYYHLIKEGTFPALHHRDILSVIVINIYSEEQLNKMENFIGGYFDLYSGRVENFIPTFTTVDIVFNYRRKQTQKVLSKFDMF